MKLQKEDPTLQVLSKVSRVNSVPTGVAATVSGESYILIDDLLYIQLDDNKTEQLVVPERLRECVLSLVQEMYNLPAH